MILGTRPRRRARAAATVVVSGCLGQSAPAAIGMFKASKMLFMTTPTDSGFGLVSTIHEYIVMLYIDRRRRTCWCCACGKAWSRC